MLYTLSRFFKKVSQLAMLRVVCEYHALHTMYVNRKQSRYKRCAKAGYKFDYFGGLYRAYYAGQCSYHSLTRIGVGACCCCVWEEVDISPILSCVEYRNLTRIGIYCTIYKRLVLASAYVIYEESGRYIIATIYYNIVF